MELFDIVDENGIPTGKTVERNVAHKDGIRHRSEHVWIARHTPTGTEVLMQKRAMIKDSFRDVSILQVQDISAPGRNRLNLRYVS